MTEGDQTRDWAVLKTKNGEETLSPGHSREEGSGFLEAVYGIWWQPAATFRQLGVSGRFRWGLLLYGLVLLFDLVVSAASGEPMLEDFLRRWSPWMSGVLFVAVYPLVLGAMFTVVACLHGCALLLGGRGEFRGFFAATAFAGLPAVLLSVLNLLTFPGAPLLRFLVSAWILVLQVLAIRECYQVPTARAILIGVLPAAFLCFALIWLVAWVMALAPDLLHEFGL